GSVNTTEFFVTVAAAATFFAELGASPLQHLIPLVLGGVLAAPIGGWAVKHVPARALMIAVGLLIVMLSIFQLLRAFRLISFAGHAWRGSGRPYRWVCRPHLNGVEATPSSGMWGL